MITKRIKKQIEKYRRLTEPAKAAVWFTICYVIQRGIQFICMPIYTRILPAEEYGIYTTFMSWVNLISIFTSLGIYGNVFNKAMIKFESERKEYISSIQWLTVLCAMIFAVTTGFLKYCKIDILELENRQILLMTVYLLFFPTIQYWYQEQRFQFRYKALVGITIFSSLASILLGVAGVLFVREDGLVLISAAVFSQTVVGIVLFVKIAYSGRVFYRFDYWKWSLKLAMPLIPSSLSEILLGHADRIMIRYIYNASMSAIYTTVYQLSMVITVIRMGINGAYIPWLYYSLKNKQCQSIKKVINLIVVLFGYLTIIAMMLGPELMKFVAPAGYYEAVVDIPAIMLGCFFVSVYYIFEQVEFYYERVFFSSFISVTGAIVNIILNLICIRTIGYLAAGYTTMVTYMFMAVMHGVYIVIWRNKNKDIRDLFDFKFLISLSLLLIGTGGGCLRLYRMDPVFRNSVILSLIILAYFNRRKIKDFISLPEKNT